MTENVTIMLGAEWDENLRSRLVALLKDMGATSTKHEWGVGGSQELESFAVMLGDEVLLVEAETYVGLSLTGSKNLLDKIRERLASTALRPR